MLLELVFKPAAFFVVFSIEFPGEGKVDVRLSKELFFRSGLFRFFRAAFIGNGKKSQKNIFQA